MEACKKLNNQPDDRGLPQEIVIDDIKSCESNDIVNRLNQYFTSNKWKIKLRT